MPAAGRCGRSGGWLGCKMPNRCPDAAVAPVARRLALWCCVAASSSATAQEPVALALVAKEAAFVDGRWIVRYQLRYRGEAAATIPSGEIELEYRATISNSRCWGHGLPGNSQARWKPLERNRTTAPVVGGEDQSPLCREILEAGIATNDVPKLAGEPPPQELRLEPGGVLWLTLTVTHDHAVHGRYEPLLGTRRLELRLGEWTFFDELELVAAPSYDPPAQTLSPPAGRSVDDAARNRPVLHISPREAGKLYFRFAEVETRPGAVLRVAFWYRTKRVGTGACHLRVTEYQDDDRGWRRLEGGFDEGLPDSPQWTYFERQLATGGAATHLAIDFRYPGETSGEAWIDGVTVLPDRPRSPRP